jgi:hypothetical protein
MPAKKVVADTRPEGVPLSSEARASRIADCAEHVAILFKWLGKYWSGREDLNLRPPDLPPISARGIIRLFGIAWFLKYL